MASLFGHRNEMVGNGQPTRRTRTWNDNGVQYTRRESSYNSPNAAFFTFSQTTAVAPDGRPAPPASNGRRASLLGTVFNGLADYVTSSANRDASNNERDLAYGDGGSQTRRSSGRPKKSLFAKVAANLTSPQSSSMQYQQRHRQERPRDQHQQFRRTSTTHGRPVSGESYTSSEESDVSDSDSLDEDATMEDRRLREALENAAEHHRREAKLARRQLEQASRQSMGNSRHLQHLARKVEEHEHARQKALRDLNRVQSGAEDISREQRGTRHPQQAQRERNGEGPAFDDPVFNDPFFDDFFDFPSQRQRRTTHPSSAQTPNAHANAAFGAFPFAAFDSFFSDFERMHDIHQHSFSMPGATFSFATRPQASRSSTGPRDNYQRQQPTNFSTFPPPPRAPPATLLKPEEAKRLFITYNERWNTISAVDSNIPFPARNLKPANLQVHNTLWAPSVSSAPEMWSAETVMKANAQAFFLGAVGMKPAYSEVAGGKIELGVDKAGGSPAQAQQLIAILKKERTRWHSDRLGKRNGGGAGTNEALQNDERARAVYHGVCELIEAAQ